MKIDDQKMENLLYFKTRVRVNGKLYYATSNKDFVVGDLVLDHNDGSHGVLDMIDNKRAAIRDGCVVEIVTIDRLIRLTPVNELN